ALLVAVAAMSAVGFFTDRVRQAVSQQAGESLAADLRLESDYPIDPGLSERARARALETAELVNFRSVVLAGTASSLADVRGVTSGYPLRGEVRIADALAAQPYVAVGVPAPGEVWAEPSLLARLGAQVGDSIEVGQLQLRVTRTLEFRPDEGWRFMEIAPTVLLNYADIERTGLIQPGSVVEYERLFAGPERAVGAFREEIEPLIGLDQELEDIRDGRPEVRSSVERAERFLILSALVSVLLGGVAVAMAARRFLTRHLDGVALMKCLGAQHRDVLRLTLTQLLLLAAFAGIVGTAIGFLTQQGLTVLLDDLVEAQLPPPSLRGVFIGPITALTVALGFALPPLLRLRSVPPARVLRHDLEPPPLGYTVVYGIAAAAVTVMLYWLFGDLPLILYLLGGSAVTFVALYGAGRALVHLLQHFRGRVGVAWRYGVANVARRGVESSVQVVAFGIGLMVLLLLTVVRTQLMETWQATLPESAPNHFVINIQPAERPLVAAILERNGIAAPVFTPLVRARISRVNGIPVNEYPARDERAADELRDDLNLTWAAELPPDNELLDGQWWVAGDTRPRVSIEEELLDEIGLALGDELTYSVAGQELTAEITSERRVHWDSFRPNFFMVLNPGVLDAFPQTYITSFFVEAGQRRATLDLARELPSVSVIDIGAVLDQVRRAMTRAALAVQYVFLFTFAAGITVLLAAIQSTRDERLYESAVLRTLGAGRGVVLQGVAAEFTALGLLAGILGAVGAGLIGFFVARELFELDYVPGPMLWLTGLVAGGLIVGVTGTLAARSVVNEPPVSTLRRI
ncbi:MAG TPA: FtsX-like permease family protein, partial [Gammaproteobacteria bacterium]|nr:FtsX-like permease family protein [Gammaproteobacteria bacterium]